MSLNKFASAARRLIFLAIALSVSACQTSGQQVASPGNKPASDKTIASSGSAIGEKLDESALERLLEKKKIKGVTAEDATISLEFSKFGHTNDLFVKKYNAAGKITEYDRGSWWIVQGKICRRLQTFFNGKPECYTVHKTGEKYQFIDKNDKIAFRFVVVGNLDPTAAKNKARLRNRALQAGTALGYSDLCKEFQGQGVDNSVGRDIKQFFARDAKFKKGYESFSHYYSYDKVTELNQCVEMNNLLKRIYNLLPET